MCKDITAHGSCFLLKTAAIPISTQTVIGLN